MLVSVIVITFNSERYVAETLEGIRTQSYKQLELIISDDASTDSTVEICRSWIKENGSRFERVELLAAASNTGSSANCNRGLAEARGEWIKFCAGDDRLKPDCISDNMEFISADSGINVLFSKVEIYDDSFKQECLVSIVPDDPFASGGIMACGRSAESQYKMLLVCDRIHFTPSLFINRTVLNSIGGFDEHFRLLEDYPLWLNLTRSGHRLYFMDKVTMNYRKHNYAVNNMQFDYLIKPSYFRTESFRNWLRKKIDNRPAGPTPEKRAKAKSFIWGEVTNSNGQKVNHSFWVPEGYTLTAKTAVAISKEVLHGNWKSGYQTPAGCYGSGLIEPFLL